MPIRNMTKAEAIAAIKRLSLQREAMKVQETQWLEAVGNVLSARFHTPMYAEAALRNELRFLTRGLEPKTLEDLSADLAAVNAQNVEQVDLWLTQQS